jgi:Tfp pilus assembly protein PilF
MTYFQTGDKEAAFKELDNAFKMNYNKNNAHILINLGKLYQNAGEAKKANICFIKAQNLNPGLFKNDK